MDLKIDREISSLHRALTLEEQDQLEANIIADGKVIDPVVYWEEENTILDGENRYKIAVKHGLPIAYEPISLPTMTSAKAWVIQHQIGRRNLNNIAMSQSRALVLGILGDPNQAAGSLGVSRGTVYRNINAELATMTLPPDLQERLKNGSLKASQADLVFLGKLDADKRESINNRLRKDRNLTLDRALYDYRRVNTRTEPAAMAREVCADRSMASLISFGGVQATEADVEHLGSLPVAIQTLVHDIVTCTDTRDLGLAIDIATKPVPDRPRAPADVAKLSQKIISKTEEIARLIDDIKSELQNTDRTQHDDCMSALRHFLSTFRQWMQKYLD